MMSGGGNELPLIVWFFIDGYGPLIVGGHPRSSTHCRVCNGPKQEHFPVRKMQKGKPPAHAEDEMLSERKDA
ncbi:unnamed protein product [marine sediment metagenome]|uniref:Uncharacterized protein n=1 Tax=marine sediment metagenome TaxID=412755 RepID=X1EFT1_9ZZZZ